MLSILPVKDYNKKELEIIRSFFNQYQQELDDNLCFQRFDDELENPSNKYGEPAGTLLVAYWNLQPVGCIALYPLSATECEMKRLFVLPAFRQHKIGKALALQLVSVAQAKGYSIMKLDTLQKLQPAIKLYKNLGFYETTSYYNNPLEGVVYMEKEL